MNLPRVSHQRSRAIDSAHRSSLGSLLHLVRKLVVVAVGLSVLVFGVVLIVLPGPSIPVILLGLAILATEFLWARKSLALFRRYVRQLQLQAWRMLGFRRKSATIG